MTQWEQSVIPLTGPDDFQRVDILKRLLALSRAGRIGPIYCSGYNLEIGTWAVEYFPLHICMERRAISWRDALKLIEAESKPVERKPVASTKQVSNLRRLIQKRLA